MVNSASLTKRPDTDAPAWQHVRLGDIATIAAGGTPSRSIAAYWNGTVPWVTTSEIDFNTIDSAAQSITELGLQNSAAKVLQPGTLVMALYGQGKTRGKVGLLGIQAATNQACASITLRHGTDPLYVFYSLAYRYESIRSLSNTGNQDNLNGGLVRSISILLPPLAEQQAIAQALSDVDALIRSLERLIAKKRDLKQAAMQQLLTGQTRLPGFSGEWKETHVREVISECFCGPSPTCEERNISGHVEWGVLKTTAATKTDGWNWRAHKALPKAFWNKPNLELREGDVIVTKAGPRHRVGVTAWIDYVPERIIPSGKMIALRPDRDCVVPLMLAAAIDSKKSQKFLDDRTTGMAESQVNFENDALLQAPIAIPSMEEQRAIAEVLSDMDAEITALEARLAKTRDLKQGMMQELLTGRTRLV
jgi:type I restriction enzyme S subunit